MSRCHFYRPITDDQGNVVPLTKVTVFENQSTLLLQQTMWKIRNGTDPSYEIENPYTTSDGLISFYLDKPQSVRIELVGRTGVPIVIDDLQVLPPADEIVQATTGFEVTNTAAAGQFLKANTSGSAAWTDAAELITFKATPLQQLKVYTLTPEFHPDLFYRNAAGQAIAPTIDDVWEEDKPEGISNFAYAAVFTTSDYVTTQALQFPERGRLTFMYKVLSSNGGVGAARIRAELDDGTLVTTTTPRSEGIINEWQIGYLSEIPAGSHTITFRCLPDTDLASSVSLAQIIVSYGDNVPAHNHEGTKPDTVSLGRDVSADYKGTTVIGAAAEALGEYASVLGHDADANLKAVAIGAYTHAGEYGLALGYNATNLATASYGVSLGNEALAEKDDAVSIGSQSKASGLRSLAIGSKALSGSTSADESIAIGYDAQALGHKSVALGSGTRVAAAHEYSIAIGPGVTTTAANQARLGDATTTVVAPGDFRQNGNAVLGSSSSTVGFFGEPGVVRPVVTGSRMGNATLTALLAALDIMGLIKNETSSGSPETRAGLYFGEGVPTTVPFAEAGDEYIDETTGDIYEAS